MLEETIIPIPISNIQSKFGGNANTLKQVNEIAAIIQKRNASGWKLISTSKAIVEKNNFQIFNYFG